MEYQHQYMNPTQRIIATFDGIPTDRCPVVPKIWFDLAARLTKTEPRAIIENPEIGLISIIDAANACGSDAARMLFLPARKTRWVKDRLVEVDQHENRVGEIDLSGGWATHLDNAGDFSIENPEHIGFRTFRKHHAPRVNTLEDARRIAIPDQAFWATHFEDRLKRAKARAGDQIALIGDCDSATLAWYIEFRGMEQAMYDLMEEPEIVHAVMEKGVEYAIERGRFCIDQGLNILRLNDSVGNMSVISPSLWREFIKPHMTTVCSELHRYASGAKIYCHICGNVLPIMPDLVETGLDAIGPLDPLGGFSVAQAREKAGQAITLMGGVNTLDFIHAQPENLRQQALECIRQGQIGNSRFILGSGCVVPPSANPANLVALLLASECAAAEHASP